MPLRLLVFCSCVALVGLGCDDEGGVNMPPLVDGGNSGRDGGGIPAQPAVDAGPAQPVEADSGIPSCGAVGSTMACVGPGGCSGGQVCLADGSYGACDCGAPAENRCAPAGTPPGTPRAPQR